MSDRHYLIAYLSTLATLAIVFVSALVAAGWGVSVTEAFALGTITGGLIGVLRLPSMRTGGVSDQTAQTMVDKIPPTTGEAATAAEQTP